MIGDENRLLGVFASRMDAGRRRVWKELLIDDDSPHPLAKVLDLSLAT